MKQEQSRHSSVLKLCGFLLIGQIFFFGLQSFYPLRAQNPDRKLQKVWIYLDEGLLNREDFVRLDFPQKTLNRLAKRGACDDIFSDAVPGKRISAQIEKHVDRIVCYSRSLKAYSAFIEPAEIAGLQNLPFVKNVAPVKIYRRQTRIEPAVQLEKSTGGIDFYGDSYDQLRQLNIPAVHDSGYTGAGVRIAIIDAGFYKDHSAFQHIITSGRLIAERDFIFNDNNVQDEVPADTALQPQHKHGTSVWSVVGGYVPDVLIGAAYGAEYLLAKSEIIASETILEEDLFVAAVEWAEANGADIISSSVAYRDFDYIENDYLFEQLDGQTTNAAKAINWAFERGVLPVICAGNETLNFPQDGGLLTPADAYGALTVGAVKRDGQIAGFSSHGPTADGRIKPDLCALGFNTYIATSFNTTTYAYGSGTSLSTPLIAGAAALLMEKYPNYPPIKIIELLKAKSSLSDTPDNRYGWGIPDVYQSMFEADTSAYPIWKPAPEKIYAFPNPVISGVTFAFRWTNVIPDQKPTHLKIYNLLGELVWQRELRPQIAGTGEFTYWNLKNLSGEIVPAGVYIVAVKDKHTTIRGKCLILH